MGKLIFTTEKIHDNYLDVRIDGTKEFWDGKAIMDNPTEWWNLESFFGGKTEDKEYIDLSVDHFFGKTREIEEWIEELNDDVLILPYNLIQDQTNKYITTEHKRIIKNPLDIFRKRYKKIQIEKERTEQVAFFYWRIYFKNKEDATYFRLRWS